MVGSQSWYFMVRKPRCLDNTYSLAVWWSTIHIFKRQMDGYGGLVVFDKTTVVTSDLTDIQLVRTLGNCHKLFTLWCPNGYPPTLK